MNDTRRIATIACVMLVVLRLAIGWQLLYEGFWKIKTLKSPTPWTAAGYLRNAQGPMRGFFRGLAGDPDDLDWLNVDAVAARWDRWQSRFVRHHDLDKRQRANLNRWINGSKTFEADVPRIPDAYDNTVTTYAAQAGQTEFKGAGKEGAALAYEPGRVRVELNGKRLSGNDFEATDGTTVVLKRKDPVKADDELRVLSGNRLMALRLDDVVHFNAEKSRIVVDGRRHLTTAERETLLKALIEDGYDDLEEPVKQVYKRAKDGISYKEKLSATVRGNPDWIDNEKLQRVGKINQYKSMLDAHEQELAAAQTDFQFDHLSHTWEEIQTARAELVGPVKALDKELKDKAVGMLTVKQLQAGPVGEPWTSLRISDLMTILGLTILGALLILGLGTRFAAIMAAVMLFMFYAAMPPWPGVPEAPGPEHSFIVNKNLIEVVALLAIAALPSGRWFGVDGMLGRLWARRKAKATA